MMTIEQLDNSLARTTKKLIANEVFFGVITMQLRHEWVDNPKETLSIRWDGNDFMLRLGIQNWEVCNDFERYSDLKHEILHLAMFHVTESGVAFRTKKRKDLNIAMDMVVDQYIKDADKHRIPYVTIDSVAQKLGVSPAYFPVEKGFKLYYDLIQAAKKQNKKNQQQQQQQQQSGGGQGGCGGGQGQGQGNDDDDSFFDSDDEQPQHNPQQQHSGWDNEEAAGGGGGGQNGQGQGSGSGIDSEIIKDMMENAIKEKLQNAEEATLSSGRGTIPSFMEEILKQIKKREEPAFNWGGYIRQFVQTSLKSHQRNSKHKLNMRYEGWEDLFAGHKKEREYDIMLAIDTSGSVSTKLLEKFNDQMYHISKKANIDVVECDAQINAEFKYKRNEPLKVVGRGGTEFQPVIDHYLKNKRKYSCLIYFTDGECPAPKVDFGASTILWVTYGDYINNDLNKVGKMIHIEEKDY